jgi:hypothetical protein
MDDDTQKQVFYRIIVSGRFDKRWEDWFHGMKITTELNRAGNPITALSGPVIDQVALRGLMIKLWDLNLELVSVNCMGADTEYIGGNPDETEH